MNFKHLNEQLCYVSVARFNEPTFNFSPSYEDHKNTKKNQYLCLLL